MGWNEDSFAFRLLTRSEFPLLGGWLTQPHVARWWADDASPQALEETYGGNVDGTEPSEVFIAWRGAQPVGFVQRFRLESYPSYLEELTSLVPVPAHACSIDYLVGPSEALQRGWGTAMVAAFVQTVWDEDLRAQVILVPVHAANRASWRVLERAGFERVASGPLTPDNPADNPDHHVYRLNRPGRPACG